jgi:hypothetical protein
VVAQLEPLISFRATMVLHSIGITPRVVAVLRPC